jgi:NAD(P)-dependent dehydrogenase (short-subunit alcohol dehydrogenase family)
VIELDGAIALVTGGASGIGAATSQRLSDEGCRVVIADVQDDLGAQHAAAIGGRYLRLDVADPRAWTAAVDDVTETAGALGLVHLNAGVTTHEGDLSSVTDEQYRRVMGANVDGVVFGLRAVSAAMAEPGAIVVTASLAGLFPFAPDPIYTLTKHAVVGLVRAAASQLAVRNVTINAICPAVVDTPLISPEGRAHLAAIDYPVIPPDEIADAVVTAARSGRTGDAWACVPGRAAEPFVFGELPVTLPRLIR